MGKQVESKRADGKSAPLIVRTFGSFALSWGEASIGDNANRAWQLWNMLAYLLANRDREVPRTELIGVLWPGGATGDPENALKNIAYRIRMLLSEAGLPDAQSLLIYKRGICRWNPELPTQVDCERFEALCRRAQAEPPRLRLETLLQAVRLYQGPYLAKLSACAWTASLRERYQGLYSFCVRTAAGLLMQQRRDAEQVELCRQAVSHLPFEEEIHILLIRGLDRIGRTKEALACYRQAVELFYRERGTKPSETFSSLYQQIAHNAGQQETGIEEATRILTESEPRPGAFFCEFEVFKELYRLKARSILRSGQPVFLALLTVHPTQEEIEQKLLNRCMDRLLRAVQSSLRRGDAVTRFSERQYLLLLPLRSFEDGHMVLDRIITHFTRANARLPVRVEGTLEPVDPT